MAPRQRVPAGRQGAAVPASRRARIAWLVVAVGFLALLTVALWLLARTRAGEGRVAEPSSVPSFSASAARLLPWYPSPFRDAPEAESGEPDSAPPPPTFPDSSAFPEGEGDRVEIVYHGKKNDRMEIALTFDDGPHPRLTPIILEILREYGIKATFFMVGENVGYYPAAAAAVAAEGHEIGNHTFSHRKFGKMSEHEMVGEISACEEALSRVTPSASHLIRPPEGQMNDTMQRVIGSLDYRIILWDVDTRDWAHTPPAEICRHILDTVEAGDIILMHDFIGYDSPTPEALRMVIPALLARGYRFVTVGEMLDGE